MIFVTVGAQMPFDRLVRTIDRWAGEDTSREVFAQIGPTDYRPSNIDWSAELKPEAFRDSMHSADLIVAHAGMGTILTALEFGTPILVVPRRACFRETRNDHQVGSARALQEKHGIAVAWDEMHLLEWLQDPETIPAPMTIAPHASLQLLGALRAFINEAREGERIATPAIPATPATPKIPAHAFVVDHPFPRTAMANQEQRKAA